MEPSHRQALHTSPFFISLPEETRRALAEVATALSAERREQLFRQGEPAERLYLVVSGRVKLTQAGAEGEEVIVRFVGPGEILAGIALVPDSTYPVRGEMAEGGRLLAWGRHDLARLAEEHPQLALRTTAVITERLREIQERFRELATQRVAQRLARALLRLARQTGRRTEAGVELDLPLSRQDLAEMTGTTLYSVSRLLSTWEEQGIVTGGRERVVVRDPHRLVEIAEDLPRGEPVAEVEGAGSLRQRKDRRRAPG